MLLRALIHMLLDYKTGKDVIIYDLKRRSQ